MAQKTEYQAYGLPGKIHSFLAKTEAVEQFLYAVLSISRTDSALAISATGSALTIAQTDTLLSIKE